MTTVNAPCYISVDIETTGPTPGAYEMYELGACVVGEERTFERKISLSRNAQFSLPALEAVKTSEATLRGRKNTTPPLVAMKSFTKWVNRVAKGRRVIFVANNAPFDWMFVAWYYTQSRINNPFGHCALDMKAFFMGMTGRSWQDSRLSVMASFVGLLFDGLPHRALLDAQIQGEIFHRLLLARKEIT